MGFRLRGFMTAPSGRYSFAVSAKLLGTPWNARRRRQYSSVGADKDAIDILLRIADIFADNARAVNDSQRWTCNRDSGRRCVHNAASPQTFSGGAIGGIEAGVRHNRPLNSWDPSQNEMPIERPRVTESKWRYRPNPDMWRLARVEFAV
jgi:hypothetical protein